MIQSFLGGVMIIPGSDNAVMALSSAKVQKVYKVIYIYIYTIITHTSTKIQLFSHVIGNNKYPYHKAHIANSNKDF